MERRTPEISDWFPAQVTEVDDSGDLVPVGYAFKEIAVQGDGSVSEKVGGRVGTFLNPGVEITGGPFAVDDIVLARTARNAGGLLWELMAAGGGGGASSTTACADAVGWASTDCLLLTVRSASGFCSGIDTSQWLTLTWDAGDSRWESGDDAVDVPEDDFTHDNGIGPAWFQLADGEPKLRIDSVYGMYLGCDSGALLFAFGGVTLCDGTHVACGDNSFVVAITCTCCTATEGWDGAGWYCVEDDSANGKGCVYLGVDPCDATVILSGPHADAATCEAACCEIAGWGGAGWYCVFNGVDCEALELTTDDACDDTITICSGPYASEALAIAGCGVVCCPDGTTLTFSLSGITNTGDGDTSLCDCPLFDRSYTVTLSGGTGDSTSTAGATCDSNTTTFARATCSATGVTVEFRTGADPRAAYTLARSSWDCDGVNVMTLVPESVPLCTGFPATLSVTVTP